MVLAIFLENLAFKRHLGESEVSVELCKTIELVDYFILDRRFSANVKE